MRKIALLVAVLLIICSGIYTACALEKGDTGDEVIRLQERLIYLGFLDGEADGSYGTVTARAVEELHGVLKTTCGITTQSDGESVSDEVWVLLWENGENFYAGTMKIGCSGSEVLRLQRVLVKSGYLDESGKSGVYDEKTFRAVYAFQKKCGLTANGIADKQTQISLYSMPRMQETPVHIVRGEENEQILAIQQKLWDTGYLESEPDGKYGSDTAAAITWLMDDVLHGNFSGEYIDVCLMQMVQNASILYERDLELGDEDPQISRILRLLTRYGYYDGEITQVYTADCRVAVQYFQQVNRLPVTGRADIDMQQLLYSGRAAKVETPAARTIQPGEESGQVLEFQQELIRLGFLTAPADGIYGSETEAAARELMLFLGENGYAEAAAWDPGDPRVRTLISGSIKTSVTYQGSGATGSEVFRMQRRLNALGYLSRLKIDGTFGEETEKALAQFQQMNGLSASGKANKETQDLLYSRQARERQCPWRLDVSLDEVHR